MTPRVYRIVMMRAIAFLLELSANPTAKAKGDALVMAQSLNFFADQMSEEVITEGVAEQNFNRIQPIRVRKKKAA